MDFRTRQIRKEPRPKKVTPFAKESSTSSKESSNPILNPQPRPKKQINIHLLTIGGALALMLVLIFSIFHIVKSLDFSSIVFSFGQSLKTDEQGQTNILLIGVGGEGHEGSQLTDTIILASIDYKNKIVPMLSIPRDFYIMSKKQPNQRINSIYYNELQNKTSEESIQELSDIVSDISKLDIQYYIKVDFGGFEKIIDSIEGVDVYVENAIYDPHYPRGETIEFQTFSIDEGLQHLDGATALKYVRSRKTTSDFDRAKRQQQVLFAAKEKALSLEILGNAGKIQSLYDSAGDSIETNLTLPEIIELGRIGKDFQKDDIYPLVLNDDPSTCGGFLYTPAREFFDGASVLLPAGINYDHIQAFVDTTMGNINLIRNNDEIQVLNGTKIPGLAGTTLSMLSRFCFNVVYYGNATNRELETSTIYYEPDEAGNPPPILSLITRIVPVKTQAGIPPEYLESERRQSAKIVIELGKDYPNMRMDDPFLSLQYLTPPATKPAEKTDTSDEPALTNSSLQ